MDRWTMDELERTDDLTFAISILDERRSRLNRYSPLSLKIQAAQSTLRRIKDEQDRFMERICKPVKETEDGCMDLSDLDDTAKETIIRNDAELKAREEAEKWE